MRTRTLQGTDPCTGTQGLWPEYSPVAQSTFVLAPWGRGVLKRWLGREVQPGHSNPDLVQDTNL